MGESWIERGVGQPKSHWRKIVAKMLPGSNTSIMSQGCQMVSYQGKNLGMF
jgi:hypothetical protein